MPLNWKNVVVYSVVGLILAAVGLTWWQAAVAVLTVCVAEAILLVWGGHYGRN